MERTFNEPISFSGSMPTKKETIRILKSRSFYRDPDNYREYERAKLLFEEVWHHVNRTVIDYLGV